MSTPRFVPRSYAAIPDLFGRAPSLEWVLPERASKDVLDQMRSAQHQHRWAILIRSALLTRHNSVREWCDAEGFNYQRTAGVLRGVVIMRLEDLAAAERTLGIEVS